VHEELVARIAAGDRVEDAATALGLNLRSLRRWRRRAWSRAPADAADVRLEREINRALATAAYLRGASAAAQSPASWEEATAWVEVERAGALGRPIESVDDALARISEPFELP
jgi:hypothetical protein